MKRIQNIDFVRGLVMIIMALDHCRDYLHVTSITHSPLNFATTTPGLFLTRWITHLCAPTFVFLSGTSAYISLQNKGDVDAARRFLFKRGLWLIVLEFTVVNFLLWTDMHFQMLLLQVIAAIGFGMIILGSMIKLPLRTIGIIALVIIAGHDALMYFDLTPGTPTYVIGSLLFRPAVFNISEHFSFAVMYPIIPWAGILLLGYFTGQFFYKPDAERKKHFLRIGLTSLLAFVVMRSINIYGDPAPWPNEKTSLFTFLSFLNTSKYPPSLLFTLMTLGIMALLLWASDGRKNKLTDIVSVYGKVPLFYFLVHFALIHGIMYLMLYLQGVNMSDLPYGNFSFGRPPKDNGLDLPYVYLVWIGVVVALYPVCKWFGAFKAANGEKTWVHYL